MSSSVKAGVPTRLAGFVPFLGHYGVVHELATKGLLPARRFAGLPGPAPVGEDFVTLTRFVIADLIETYPDVEVLSGNDLVLTRALRVLVDKVPASIALPANSSEDVITHFQRSLRSTGINYTILPELPARTARMGLVVVLGVVRSSMVMLPPPSAALFNAARSAGFGVTIVIDPSAEDSAPANWCRVWTSKFSFAWKFGQSNNRRAA